MSKMKKIDNVELTFLSIEDYEEMKEIMIAAYTSMPEYYWKKDTIERLITLFPEGQVVLKINGKIAGCALSIIVDESKVKKQHSYREITGNFQFTTHDATGDMLYGIDVFIHPDYRGLRLGRRMYDYRKELCEQLNLKGITFGARMPHYHQYKEELSPKSYIEKVRNKEIHDPVLSFQLYNDFAPSLLLRQYLEGDKESGEFAVLMEWDNIYYEERKISTQFNKSTVRLGLIQWQMRSYKDIDELMEHAEFFIDAVSGYRADFALLPEFFNAPLMSAYNHLTEAEAIRNLAQYTEEIKNRFPNYRYHSTSISSQVVCQR